MRNPKLSSLAKWAVAGVSALAISFGSAVAGDQAPRCLDEYCKKVSLSSLDGIFEAGAGDVITQDFGAWGFDLKGMNTAVKPGDDFNAYAGGTYLDNLVIPADRTSFGSFNTLAAITEQRLNGMISDIASRNDLTGNEAKIAILYNDTLDQTTRNDLDIAPVYDRLLSIRQIKDHKAMAKFMGSSAGDLGATLFGMYVGADDKNPTVNALSLFQGGLSLPDRDYYLDEKFADKKVKYQAYVADIFRMIGYPNAEEMAAKVVAFETEVAKVSWTRVESRDPDKTYNPMTWAELKKYAPAFDWDGFAKASGTAKAKKIIVGQNTAVVAIADLYAKTDIETLKAWQTFKVVNEAAPNLSQRFIDAQWGFFARDLNGAKEQRPLWKKAVGVTETVMGEALGQAYAARYFPESSKATMVALVENLRTALAARIRALTWMSDTTKEKALGKLYAIKVKVGYPDKWRDYSGLDIKKGDLVGNLRRSGAFEWRFMTDKIDQKVDPDEWEMTPQTVNAYYHPTKNEIVFPAAILQAPFFNPDADPAINYGGIGGVIGHEFTHGFDDQGRKYAADGSLSDWWTEEDAKKFDVQAQKLGAQYDGFEVFPGHNVQGALTMGENIADLGGILIALDAYRLSLSGQTAPVLDGFTGDQRVFLGWSQVWRLKRRDETMKALLVSDPHSPAKFRVIGPMRNIDEWYKAFDIKEGDKDYLKPEDRVKIW